MFRILCQTILILLVIIASAYSFDPLFDSQVDYQMGVLISSALRADFTNDGFIDIICASNSLYNGSAYNHFNYYINNGDGTFREPLEIPAGLNNSVMLQGDFNSDGWKDFVTVSNTPYIPKFYINIYMNQGNGTLIYKQAYSNFSTPYIAVMDINDDGLDDILQMDNSNINVLFCKGDGTFTFGTNGEEMVKIPMDRFGQMRPWDVNKDDYPDLLIQGSRTVTPPAGQPYSQSFIATYINNADTTFQFAAEFLYGSSADVSITGTNPGYYNSDSNEDLLIRDNQNLWTVLTGNGDGSFSLHASFGLTTDLPVADGDINGDGLTDLIISDSENATMSVMLNTGDADINFADPVVYSGKWDDKPNYPTLSSVDLNNDAYDDIILSKYALSTIINYGDGTFPILKTIENMGIEAIDMITEDFNRDGWPDIMTIDANRLYLSYNDGTGDFLPREIISSGLEWQNGIFSGDFNADEIPDFAVTKGLKLFYGREEGGFQAGPSYGDSLFGLSAIGGASAYLNDDRFIDFALYYFGSLRIVLSDSSGAYQLESYVFSTDGVSQINDIAIADIDNDNDMDILFGFKQNLYINYNDGDGNFHSRDSLTTAGGASWLVLDDFNSDGTTDIAATHAESFNSYVFIHLNNGNSTFGPAVKYGQLYYPLVKEIKSADMDNDGDADLVTTIGVSNEIAVYFNQGDGTFPEIQYYAGGDNPQALAIADFDNDSTMDVAVSSSVPGRDFVYLFANSGRSATFVPDYLTDEIVPRDIVLSQNYPNPFNPKTMLRYQLPVTSQVDLSIYNILGQKVVTLVSEKQPAGTYNISWDASGFASGMYFYKLETPANVLVQKMLLIK